MKNQSDYSPDYDTYGRSHHTGTQRSESHHQLSDSEITVAKVGLLMHDIMDHINSVSCEGIIAD